MTYYNLKIFLLIFVFSHLSACSDGKFYQLSGNSFGTIYYISIENDKIVNPNEIHSDIKYILNVTFLNLFPLIYLILFIKQKL